VFTSIGDVTRTQIDVMQEQQDTGRIEVSVLSDEPQILFPELSRDFTIIDGGDVIARTLAYDKPTAMFHFYDPVRSESFGRLQNELITRSRSLEQFRARWEALRRGD
jgi:hypothetical protein